MKNTVLYIDDEPNNLKVFKVSFFNEYHILIAESAKDGLQLLRNNEVAVCITDQRMPEISGIEFIQMAHNEFPDVIYMLLSAYSDFDVARDAINQGIVYRFILKPWKENDIKIDINNAIEKQNLKKKNKNLYNELIERNSELERLKEKLIEENLYLREEITLNHNFNNIIYQDDKFKQVLQQIEQVADTKTTVLITGETGTGKELVARAVHDLSPRNNKPLIKINCASLPDSLIESELFGYEKGAFTGATSRKKGKFEIADGGSIFLDEIGEIPLALQAKLLRVIQEEEFDRIGSHQTIKIDIRIIAATNRKLEQEIKVGHFREDLYYRLNVFPVHLPPLRERPKDIPPLINHFINKYNARTGRKVETVSKKCLDKLYKYQWPGNIRELENIIERAVVTSNGKQLNLDPHLNILLDNNSEDSFVSLEEYEKRYIIRILKYTSWRIRGINGAAHILKMKPTTLHSRMKKLGIFRPHT